MAVTVEETVDDSDLLPEDLMPKGAARPLVRSAAQEAAQVRRAEAAAEAAKIKEANARLAQVVNLHIAGFSLADIGASIGASESEVERMLTADVARYVRTQPALRTYVRNWISSKYMAMLEADWDEAKDPAAKDRLDNQDRVIRILDRMAKLHGAEMPTQAEVTLDAAPEAVDRLVQRLAAGQGLGYDTSVFDTVPGEVIHEAARESERELAVSGNRVAEDQPGDEPL